MTDDLISRQAAIDAIRAMQTYKLFAGDNMLLIDQAEAHKELMVLPPAEPQRWIPVSEKLPKENGDYLVTGRHGAVNKRKYEDGRWYGNWAVIAWMPLPEPWKGGAEMVKGETDD